jgi:hypothetical protein
MIFSSTQQSPLISNKNCEHLVEACPMTLYGEGNVSLVKQLPIAKQELLIDVNCFLILSAQEVDGSEA